MRSALLFGLLAASVAWMGASCVGPAPTRALPGSGGSTTTSSSGGGGAVGGGGSGQGGTPGCGDGRWERGEVCYDAPIIFQESGHPRPFFAMLDGDDFYDIVTVSVVADAQVVLLRMDSGSEGAFESTALAVNFSYTGGQPFVVGDFDGDSLDDVLLRRSGNAGSVLEHWSNNQMLGFTSPLGPSIDTGENRLNSVVKARSLSGGGRDDVFVAYCEAADCSGNAAFGVYLGDGSFAPAFANEGLGRLRAPLALDYDPNPGVLAVVGIGDDGMPRLEVMRLGANVVSELGSIAGATPSNPRDVAVGQLDGVDDPDVVLTSGGTALSLVLNPSSPTRDVIDIGMAARQVELVDMDNDDDLDIVLGMAGRIHWLPNEGTGSFGPLQPLGGLGESDERFDVADVNGDGAPDFVSYSPSNNGTSVFLSAP